MAPKSEGAKARARLRNNASSIAWAKANPERSREIRDAERLRLRAQVLAHYGGSPPCCACCGEAHVEFLTIDHVAGDGAEHRRAIGRASGAATYRWLRKNGYPDGFRVLCWNCNTALHFRGRCPHGTTLETVTRTPRVGHPTLFEES